MPRAAVTLLPHGFETYNLLVNPNNRLVKKVLMSTVESGDQFRSVELLGSEYSALPIGWLQIRWRAFPSRLRRYKEDLSAIWAARLGTGRKTAHVDDCARERAKHLLAFLAFDTQRHRRRFLLGSRR